MRIAVLGYGSMGARHARNLLELGHDVVVSDLLLRASDPLPAGLAVAADEREALRGARAVVVATPSSEHARQARLALERGCHVLVEKPLALDGRTAGELTALAEQHGLVLTVGMNLRHHPALIAIRDELLTGSLGDLWLGSLWFGYHLPAWRPQVDYRDSYSAQRGAGGGVLLDAIHELDYLVWLLGPARAVTAQLQRVSSLEIDVEDVAQLQLSMMSGAAVTVSLDYLDRSYHRGCRLVCARGTVAWSWEEEQVVVSADGVGPRRHDAPNDVESTYREELAAFLASVEGERTSLVEMSGIGDVMAIVDAARASASSGRRVELALPAARRREAATEGTP